MYVRRAVRVAVLVIILISLLDLTVAFATRDTQVGGLGGGIKVGDKVADNRTGWTVVTARDFQSGTDRNLLLGVGPDGRVQYTNSEYHNYYHVDPVEGTQTTVDVIVQELVSEGKCSGARPSNHCLRNTVIRVNISTGELTERWSRMRPGDNPSDADWHDVDQIGTNQWLVGDIQNDRAFIMNSSSGGETWSWSAQANYSVLGTRGPFGLERHHWTHLNDVEYLSDGRVMLSLRNQDSVVFINPGSGLQSNWTLGSDDEYTTLHEQHNPDYIPENQGWPAVIVADSENNRIVEYQRKAGEWKRTWHWSSEEMSWPRDADRLPNNHTLITDTNADRVFEIDQNGTIVWSMPVEAGYDAERLGTGDESTGGYSAVSADLNSTGDPTSPRERGGSKADTPKELVASFLPIVVVRAISFVSPPWMELTEFIAVAAILSSLAGLFISEAWFGPITVRSPLQLSRNR